MLNIKDPNKHHIQYNDLVKIKIRNNIYRFGKIIDINLMGDIPTYGVHIILEGYNNLNVTILDINIIKNFGDIEFDELSEKFPEWAI